MSESVSGGTVRLRLAARLARREVRRRPGRTALVALLVAVPVAAMVVGAVFVRTDHLTPQQTWQNYYGRADVVLQADPGVDPAQAPPAPIAPVRALLARSRVATGRFNAGSRALLTVDHRHTIANVMVAPMRDPIFSGMFRITSGRMPTAPDEVFLTRVAARDLGVRAGGELHLTVPTRQTFRVTGVGDRADDFSTSEIVLPPATAFGSRSLDASTIVRFVELPAGVSAATLRSLESRSAGSSWAMEVSPQLVAQDNSAAVADANRKVHWSWVLGAVVLTIAGIVIASAFATGARRQLVTLGQLAGHGAPSNLLYRVLLLQGTWTGAVGAAVGVGLGAATLAIMRPHVDDIFGHQTGGYVVRVGDLLPIAVLGVVAATVAAAIPARTAARVPVLAALAGRRPQGRVPRWLPLTGAFMVAGGLALLGLAVLGTNGGTAYETVWLLTAVVGSVSVLLGGCAIAPAYASILEPAAARTRGAWRVAIRSLARQRARTAAVVAAIAATAALAICASAFVLGAHSANADKARWIAPDRVELEGDTQPDGSSAPPAAIVSSVAHVLPQAERLSLRVVGNTNLTWHVTELVAAHESGWETYESEETQVPEIGIADPATVGLYRLDPSEQHALAQHGWLIFGTATGSVQFEIRPHVAPGQVAAAGRSFDAVMLSDHAHEIGSLPRLLVAPAEAARLAFRSRSGPVVVRVASALTGAQRDTIAAIAQTAFANQVGTAASFSINLFTPPSGPDPLRVEYALVGLALALVLLVVAVNLALSAAETRDERDVLTIVGAAPGSLARTSGYKATLLAVMGAVLAIPIGFLPVLVFVHADRHLMPLVFPWALVATLTVALPIVGGLVMTAASNLSLHLRPVRIATMAYD